MDMVILYDCIEREDKSLLCYDDKKDVYYILKEISLDNLTPSEVDRLMKKTLQGNKERSQGKTNYDADRIG